MGSYSCCSVPHTVNTPQNRSRCSRTYLPETEKCPSKHSGVAQRGMLAACQGCCVGATVRRAVCHTRTIRLCVCPVTDPVFWMISSASDGMKPSGRGSSCLCCDTTFVCSDSFCLLIPQSVQLFAQEEMAQGCKFPLRATLMIRLLPVSSLKIQLLFT